MRIVCKLDNNFVDINNVNNINALSNVMQSQLRVHIATVDHHIERIVEPMIQFRADKAYLLAYEENDSASEFLKRTKDILKKHHISVQVRYANLWDLMACIKTSWNIIQAEKKNQIF